MSLARERIVVITPAAGLSTRFPGDKMLYVVGGKPLISWTVEKLLRAGVDKLVVVLGYRAEDVLKAILSNVSDTTRLYFAYNSEYSIGGMSSSIKRGLGLVCEGEHIMVHPGDVPCVKIESIRKVMEEALKSKESITVAAYNGRKSHPIVFKPYLLKELLEIGEETRGLKGVISRHYDEIRIVETGDPGTLRDIDRIEDLKECSPDSFSF